MEEFAYFQHMKRLCLQRWEYFKQNGKTLNDNTTTRKGLSDVRFGSRRCWARLPARAKNKVKNWKISNINSSFLQDTLTTTNIFNTHRYQGS